MQKLLLIAICGAAGVLFRYVSNEIATKYWPTSFPAATFAINITGSFIIGIVHVIGTERGMIPEDLRVGIISGLLGGFTTFSAFSLEVVRLLEMQQHMHAMLYAVLSPVLGTVAAAAGIWLMRS
jgi:CrcB protein